MKHYTREEILKNDLAHAASEYPQDSITPDRDGETYTERHAMCGQITVRSWRDWEGIMAARRILFSLPHGSGVNYDWHIDQHKSNRRKFTCANAYDAMDEYGGYCHCCPFSVTVEVDSETQRMSVLRFNFHGNREYTCCGFGLREYLQDLIWESLDARA